LQEINIEKPSSNEQTLDPAYEISKLEGFYFVKKTIEKRSPKEKKKNMYEWKIKIIERFQNILIMMD
jgi:hypothetical protein